MFDVLIVDSDDDDDPDMAATQQESLRFSQVEEEQPFAKQYYWYQQIKQQYVTQEYNCLFIFIFFNGKNITVQRLKLSKPPKSH